MLRRDANLVSNRPIALFGSAHLWTLVEKAKSEGRTFYYGDKAYFGDRKKWFRCTVNALQHDGSGHALPTRFRSFGLPIRDWRTKGSHILICLQTPAYFSMLGLNLEPWLDQVTATLRRHTDRPIRLRRSKKDPKPLSADLNDAWATIVLTSNAAVDSVVAGVPVFCLGKCAASSMGLDDLSLIETPRMPDDRLRWASVLACNQWTLDEMRRGRLWREINR